MRSPPRSVERQRHREVTRSSFHYNLFFGWVRGWTAVWGRVNEEHNNRDFDGLFLPAVRGDRAGRGALFGTFDTKSCKQLPRPIFGIDPRTQWE